MGRGLKRIALSASTALMLSAALMVAAAPSAGADVGIDLSSRAAIERYLVSIGVDPADAVWQEGLKNYAGPSCPGLDWTCASADAPIVQIAAPLGTNLFSCNAAECVAVQVALQGGNNQADCYGTDKHAQDALQVCVIAQDNVGGNPNSSNTATITQSIQQSTGSEQDARQVAQITQENGSGKNVAGIHQFIGQTQNASGGAVVQSQEAHQAATVDQLTTTGGNASNIDQRQNQNQRASGAESVSQAQNTEIGTGFTCDRPGDEEVSGFDQQKNQCAEVLQNSNLIPATGGPNSSNVDQEISEGQTASNSSSVDQDQGNVCHCLGQQGDVDQFSSAPSTSEANEHTIQDQRATGDPSPSQFKDIGDPRCCQFQEDDPNNTAHIVQRTDQTASSPDAIQEALLVGDCFTSGSCTVLQVATVNGETTTNDSCTDESFCSEVLVCESTGEGEGTVCFEDELE